MNEPCTTADRERGEAEAREVEEVAVSCRCEPPECYATDSKSAEDADCPYQDRIPSLGYTSLVDVLIPEVAHAEQKQERRHEADTAVGTTWEIPVLLAATTGARRTEVLGLRGSRVDLERGRVWIDETLQRIGGELAFVPPKTDKSRREIPLPAFAVERLRTHKSDQARRRLGLGADWSDLDLVCERGDGAPLDPDGFTHGFARIAKGAGLDGVRLHDCRHCVATALARREYPPT